MVKAAKAVCRAVARVALLALLLWAGGMAWAQSPEPSPAEAVGSPTAPAPVDTGPPPPTPLASPTAAPSPTPGEPVTSPAPAPPMAPHAAAPRPRLLGVRARLLGGAQDGGNLLTLWGPVYRVVFNPNTIRFQAAGSWSAADRAREVRNRLEEVLAQHGSDPQVVFVDDRQGPVVVRTADMVLATVMDEDLPEYFGDLSSPAMRLKVRHGVAEGWQGVLQEELDQGARMRTPGYRVRVAVETTLLFLLFLGVHRLVGRLARRYQRTPAWSVKGFLWTYFVVNLLWMLPDTQPLAVTLLTGVLWPLAWFWIVTVVAGLVIMVLDALMLNYIRAMLEAQEAESETRVARRLGSLHQVGSLAMRLTVGFLAIVVYLSAFPINWTPLVTGAGVLGVALSLALQDALRDVSAGVTCILEDQFGVGDWIEVDGRSGEVVSLSVRSTRLRTVDGLFVSVPNSRLGTVVNHTNEWANVDFKVMVPYEADADRCLEMVVEEAEGLHRDWAGRVTAAPEVLGLDDLAERGVTLRVLLRTEPGQQWSARRELNRRVKARFDREGIRIPAPRLRVEEGPHREDGAVPPGDGAARPAEAP